MSHGVKSGGKGKADFWPGGKVHMGLEFLQERSNVVYRYTTGQRLRIDHARPHFLSDSTLQCSEQSSSGPNEQ